jgi:hypothetical protein
MPTPGQRERSQKHFYLHGTVIVIPDTSSALLYILDTSVAVFFNNSGNLIYPEQGFLCSWAAAVGTEFWLDS